MNAKRILCLILAAVLLLGLIASAIGILVSAEEATTAAPTTKPTQSNQDPDHVINADMIIFLILGAGVPIGVFAYILIKVNKGR